MPIPLPPETRILEEMKAIAVAQAAALKATFGLAADLTVRHFRHRHADKKERPGVALLYVQSEVDNDRGRMHTSSEQCWAMTVKIVVDLSLLPERAHSALAGDANDATGWDRLLGLARTVAGLYVDMNSPLRALVDDVMFGDVDPDEDSVPDEGRLAIAVDVLYRTLYDDPLHLLAPGENA
jgi:hypothetical protein